MNIENIREKLLTEPRVLWVPRIWVSRFMVPRVIWVPRFLVPRALYDAIQTPKVYTAPNEVQDGAIDVFIKA